MEIDIAFDFRSDARGYDHDSHSPTLRQYHKLMWSKPLPSGETFDLSDASSGVYLHHRSSLGEFFLSSDSVVPTFRGWTRFAPIEVQLPENEIEEFQTLTYTIGGIVVFPSNQIDHKPTINAARGLIRDISDRFDLTLECIRRHYSHVNSPLGPTLTRYADFFALFEDFGGYVNFFLLEDFVTDDFNVKFSLPFDDFLSPAVPQDVIAYENYRRCSTEFIESRNQRIRQLEL